MELLHNLINTVKNDKKYLIIYEIAMAILSLICLLITLVSFISHNLTATENYILSFVDNIIIFIFTIDYFARFILSQDKKKFFTKNIIDLIAIIPFGPLFQALKIMRLVRFVKVLKIIKMIAFYGKFRRNIDNFIKTNNFNYILWITLSILILGTLGIHLSENMSLGNSLWWSFVTITTVGYGDLAPRTTTGRLIAVFLMLTGISFLSMLTGTIATFFINKGKDKNSTYKSETIRSIKNRLDHFDLLSDEDVNDICKVLKALKNN